jgi:hypothetical protein
LPRESIAESALRFFPSSALQRFGTLC